MHGCRPQQCSRWRADSVRRLGRPICPCTSSPIAASA